MLLQVLWFLRVNNMEKIKWLRYKYYPMLPIGKNGSRITACKEHIALSRAAAAEGMVLLKNENKLLPLKKGVKVALFGKASADYVKGGGGSGDVSTAFVNNICDGMEEKQSEGKVTLFAPLTDFYRQNVAEQYANGTLPGKTLEPIIPQDLLDAAAGECDVAVINICRYSNEGRDRDIKDDYYLTENESIMIDAVTKRFDKVVVVLNVGGVIDTSWFAENDKISAVLLGWQAGLEGGMAQADILLGDVCPSGKLTDTFAASYSDYPSSESFNESEEYVEYTEDIFVGYRYFCTMPQAHKKVVYPFGYGLSYTDFNIKILNAQLCDDTVKIGVKITNTGNTAGKQVLQLYSASPSGRLQKPRIELRDFQKTELLAPAQSVDITFALSVDSLVSYDEQSASYVLEAGKYEIFVGSDCVTLQSALCFELKEERTVLKLQNLCIPKKLSKRMLADGSYQKIEMAEYEPKFDTSDWHKKPTWKFEHIQPDLRETVIPEGRIMLGDVVDGKNTLDEFISQLSDEALIEIVGGTPNYSVANTWGIGDNDAFGIPPVMTADGPAGLRIKPELQVHTTAWPCATLLACSWNTDIVFRVGKAAALEVKENNIGMWLAPALNIHRNPLCGRNFEYYSEDPVVSGKIAAAMVKGVQSENISACIKHFCCNNKETDRFISDSRVSERALREIYLKGFQIVVKEAEPWAVMTAYNRLNGTYTSENKELIDGILRKEWGFGGLVVSDWGNYAEQYREILAGNNLRMPNSNGKRVLKALELGLIDRGDLERNARYVFEFLMRLA